MSGNITAIIPAYNEQRQIEQTIRSIKKLDTVKQIIVVDDGSTDGTAEILSGINDLEVIRNTKNCGKGYAVKKALRYASNEYVLLIDADLGDSAGEASRMLSALEAEKGKMIIGVLPGPKVKGGMGIVKILSRNGLYFFTARDVASVLSGQRAMPVDFIKGIELPDRFGLEFKMTLEAIRRGVGIIEIPVNMRHRETANDFRGFWHRGRQCADILGVIRSEYKMIKH